MKRLKLVEAEHLFKDVYLENYLESMNRINPTSILELAMVANAAYVEAEGTLKDSEYGKLILFENMQMWVSEIYNYLLEMTPTDLIEDPRSPDEIYSLLKVVFTHSIGAERAIPLIIAIGESSIASIKKYAGPQHSDIAINRLIDKWEALIAIAKGEQ